MERFAATVALEELWLRTRNEAHQHHFGSSPWSNRVARSSSQSGVSGTIVRSVEAGDDIITVPWLHEGAQDDIERAEPYDHRGWTFSPPPTLRGPTSIDGHLVLVGSDIADALAVCRRPRRAPPSSARPCPCRDAANTGFLA